MEKPIDDREAYDGEQPPRIRAAAGPPLRLVASLRGGRTFESLRLHRNYRLYFIGQFISQAGTWLQGAAQSWLVLELTHSAVAVGLVSFWQFAPFTVLGLFGGALSDRYDRRRSLILTQALMGVSAAMLALLVAMHHVNATAVYVIAAARGIVLVLNNPSQQALMIQMVGRDELANAIALNSGLANATRIIGPGIAGVIIAAAGVGICFSLNALSYVAVIVALVLMRPQEFFPMQRAARAGRTLLRDLKEGMVYAWHTPRVLLPLAILTVVSTLGINFGVLLPILASQTLHRGAEVYGLMSSLFGVGALAGALLSAALGRIRWSMLLVSVAGFGLFELLLAPERQLGIVILCLLAVGVCYTAYTATTNTMVQLATPDALQGRVAGLYGYVFLGTTPLGAVVAGWLSQTGGTELAFGIGGAASVVMALIGVWTLRRRSGVPVPDSGSGAG